ncbi:MAG: ABC transporter permease [Bacillota bacterium]
MTDYKKIRYKDKILGNVTNLLIPLISIVLSILIGGLIIMGMGINPILAYTSLLEGAIGSKNAIAETLVKTTPLILTGLCFAFAFRCGLINIGAEGQLYMGAFLSVVAGIYLVGLPGYIHIPLALFAGFLGGGLWGLLTGWLKVRFGANEIITTVMFNYLAIYWVSFLVSGPLKEPPGNFPHSAQVALTAQLPRILEGTRLHLGLLVALLAVLLYYIFLWRTSRGYEVRVVGQNLNAAKYAGMTPEINIMLIMFIAGGMGGLAGANEILGIQKRLLETLSPGYGFDGIAVALLGLNSPIGIVLGAVLFGMLRSGGNMMQMSAGVPIAIIYVVQAMVIIFVVSGQMIKPANRTKVRILLDKIMHHAKS